MERRLSSCSIKADRASEVVQIAAEQGWHRVMFSDVIGKSVALHRVACSSKGDALKWLCSGRTYCNGTTSPSVAEPHHEIRRLDSQRLISQALARFGQARAKRLIRALTSVAYDHG
jgi:hypothetical protein